MPNVLLLIPPNREPQAAVREAIETARKRGGRLLVAAVLDPETVSRVSSALTNAGFMGEKVSDQVCETLGREYRNRARSLVSAIAVQAREAGVDADWQVEQGDPSEICARLVRAHQVGTAILVAERHSWLTRLLSRSSVRLPALPGCELRLIEED